MTPSEQLTLIVRRATWLLENRTDWSNTDAERVGMAYHMISATIETGTWYE